MIVGVAPAQGALSVLKWKLHPSQFDREEDRAVLSALSGPGPVKYPVPGSVLRIGEGRRPVREIASRIGESSYPVPESVSKIGEGVPESFSRDGEGSS